MGENRERLPCPADIAMPWVQDSKGQGYQGWVRGPGQELGAKGGLSREIFYAAAGGTALAS